MAEAERIVGWGEYQRLCRLLAKKVSETHDPEMVVGIAHGGVIVGATIATILGKDFFPIKFSRRVNASVVRKHSKLLVPPTAHLEGKRVLVVDDASVSGETMKAAVRAINRHGPREVVTAVLVRKGAYEPDYAASYFPHKVVFPWQMAKPSEGETEAWERLHSPRGDKG
jgi:hypothetical protein